MTETDEAIQRWVDALSTAIFHRDNGDLSKADYWWRRAAELRSDLYRNPPDA